MAAPPPADLKARLKTSYDAIAPAYNTWTQLHYETRLEYLEKLITLLHAALPSPSALDSAAGARQQQQRILELGAGAGIPVTRRLLEVFSTAHITANDISTTQIALGKKNVEDSPRVTWVESDMLSLSFASNEGGAFDAVIALYSLIHLPREEQDVMLERLFGWLRPGGYILANFAAEELEGMVMENWMGDEGWMFWSGWGKEKVGGKIRGVGFELLVEDIRADHVDAEFVWVIARKPLD